MGGHFRYFGWYSDTGHTELITRQTVNDLRHWHNVRKKPMVITEYGADTVAGLHQVISSSRTLGCWLQFYYIHVLYEWHRSILHQDPPFIFTEEFQAELMAMNFAAFDELRREGILHGEMIWNFADFMTKQQVNRVVGNRKGTSF